MNDFTDQRKAALVKGNGIRTGRKELKQEIADGTTSIVDVIADPPEYAKSETIGKALLWAPKIGPRLAGKILQAANVSPTRRLDCLTEHERGRILLTIQAKAAVQWEQWGRLAEEASR